MDLGGPFLFQLDYYFGACWLTLVDSNQMIHIAYFYLQSPGKSPRFFSTYLNATCPPNPQGSRLTLSTNGLQESYGRQTTRDNVCRRCPLIP